MALPRPRYGCAKCAFGWHDTPTCPYAYLSWQPPPPTREQDRRAFAQWRELERRGVIKLARFEEPRYHRLWWVVLALAVWIALIILI